MRAAPFVGFALSLVTLGAFASCSANSDSNGFETSTSGDQGATTGSGGGSASSGSGQGGDLGIDGGMVGSGGGGPPPCNPVPAVDGDGDGFSQDQGDCNDCDPNVGPNAVEVIAAASGEGGAAPEPIDEDCDGEVDNIASPCDTGLVIDTSNPMDGAKAVELCKVSSGPTDWGVAEAQWVMPDGAAPPGGAQLVNFHLGHGVLPKFGTNVNVQTGSNMLALSSGTARNPTDPGYQSVNGFDKQITGGSPQGFPKESPACPGTITGTPHDGAALEVSIRTPANAQGFSFNFNFFTFEWPGFVCSSYNDFFVAMLSPIPAGQADGNISFDSQGNPVSVNNAFLEVCGCGTGNPPAPPGCNAGGKLFPCPLGNTSLMGTGFGSDDPMSFGQDHGSTYWLQTTAPVAPNSLITIRWGVYDSGDGVLDTTTLVDNWQWLATPGTGVGTNPVEDPK